MRPSREQPASKLKALNCTATNPFITTARRVYAINLENNYKENSSVWTRIPPTRNAVLGPTLATAFLV